MQFPSTEWVGAWVAAANADERFQASGRGWDGAVGLVIQSDPGLPWSQYLRLEGAEGRWTDFELGSRPELVDGTVFTLRADYRTWKRVIRQDLDPIRGLIQGHLRVRGRLSSLLRWTRSMTVLTELAGALDTTFPDETIPDEHSA